MHICIIHINRLTGRSRRSRDPTHYWAYDRFSAPYASRKTSVRHARLFTTHVVQSAFQFPDVHASGRASPYSITERTVPGPVASELWGQGYPQVQDLYPVYPPKSKMRLMSTFSANDFNYKIV